MIFNSTEFAIFLPVVFILYWFVFNRNLRLQNLFIVFVSYIFYGWWDWTFLSLIFFSSIVDYLLAGKIGSTENSKLRKQLLSISFLVNLGILGVFKYFNFFTESLAEGLKVFGVELNAFTLNVVLPVGISFYTFQTLSYTIDVYRSKLKPTNDLVAFMAYVSFFPQLVAGPIERATNLIPQFLVRRRFHYVFAVDGVRQILWGLFMKVVIADNCAYYVNDIFLNYETYSGGTLLIGAVLFAFQIYGDFAGYSNIAIGTASLFGFKLMQNFAFPYFSRDIAEFWRRWHISLSTWFRDYLYIPLGGSRGSSYNRIRNTFIIFIVSGFWHGANWTFIVWGALNAIYFLPLMLLGKNRRNLEILGWKDSISLRETIGVITTFTLTCLAWIFFRAESVSQAVSIIAKIFSTSLFQLDINFLSIMGLLGVFLIIEWTGRREKYAFQRIGSNLSLPVNFLLLTLLVLSIYFFADFDSNYEFIYFQF